MSQKDICLIETSAGFQINVDQIVSVERYEGGTRIVTLPPSGQTYEYVCREPLAQIMLAIKRATAHRDPPAASEI